MTQQVIANRQRCGRWLTSQPAMSPNANRDGRRRCCASAPPASAKPTQRCNSPHCSPKRPASSGVWPVWTVRSTRRPTPQRSCSVRRRATSVTARTQMMATLRSYRRCVVLVDEIDKAHINVFKAFLSLMDTGRVSDSEGEIDASASVLLFTSNHLGAVWLSPAASDTAVRDRLREAGVLPELVGRINRVAVFGELTPADRLGIAALAARRVGEEYGVEVASLDPEVSWWLAEGDVASGGRSVEQTVDDVLGQTFAAAAAERVTRINITETDGVVSYEPLPPEDHAPAEDQTTVADSPQHDSTPPGHAAGGADDGDCPTNTQRQP